MRRFFAPFLVLVGLASLATSGGCELIATVDRDKIPFGTGGGVGAGGGTATTPSGGGGAGVECTDPGDCTVTVGECEEVTCVAGTCGKGPKPAGTPVGNQTAGDCKVRQCDGAGNVEQADDDLDVPDDSNECTKDVCKNGVPSNPNEPSGAPCGTVGNTVCDGTGQCVGCLMPSDCALDTECQHPTCSASGVCGVDNEPQGTKLTAQTLGDCKVAQCDGSGGTETVADGNDKPVDNETCTDDICTGDTPSNPALSAATPCSEGTGQFCDGMGACVECLQPTDCPGGPDNECQARTCSAAGVCGVDFQPMGHPIGSQTNGDCKKSVCDGGGMVVLANDDTDLPNDSNPCTNDTCSNGTPVFTNRNMGAACGGTQVCDGMGHCGCNIAGDCGTNDECKTFACNTGTCNVTYTASNTPVAMQTLHDCKQNVCDGNGNTVNINFDDPPLDDGNQCTGETCSNGVGSHPVLPINSPCTMGGTVCSAGGQCVQCNAAGQCGTDTDCKKFDCTANACGTTNIMMGTPTSNQPPGDCHENRCDGMGNEVPVIDNSDLPLDDGEQCTDEVCNAGVGSHPPKAINTMCNEAGGHFCNNGGSCVECNSGGQCASMVCTTNVCQAPTCVDAVKNGAESDVDCGGGTCPGCGTGQHCDAHGDCAHGACKANMTCRAECTDATSLGFGLDCADYCSCMLSTCQATFATMNACLDACSALTDAGICCRTYHCHAAAGLPPAPSPGDPVLHCPHASGAAPCNL